MDARRIDASGSAEPMSGLNPDEMDGEGTAFAKRRQLPRRKSQMAFRGMEERDRIKGFHYRQVFAQNYAFFMHFLPE